MTNDWYAELLKDKITPLIQERNALYYVIGEWIFNNVWIFRNIYAHRVPYHISYTDRIILRDISGVLHFPESVFPLPAATNAYRFYPLALLAIGQHEVTRAEKLAYVIDPVQWCYSLLRFRDTPDFLCLVGCFTSSHGGTSASKIWASNLFF